MSSYDCIIPVSWLQLTETILSEWCRVLTRSRDVEDFCRAFAPDYTDFFDPTTAPAWQSIPDNYLADISWSSTVQTFAADNLRQSQLHQALQQTTIAEDTTSILCSAVRHRAGVELPGQDPFNDTAFYRYYGRLHTAPYLQVAGTKSQYHFLEGLFTVTYDRQRSLYTYQHHHAVEVQLVHLIQVLFLSRRAFPGMLILPENDTWPAYDDSRLQGYLRPDEVRQLAGYLDVIAMSYTHNAEDDLFPLFADRVRRAADAELGLITLHSEL